MINITMQEVKVDQKSLNLNVVGGCGSINMGAAFVRLWRDYGEPMGGDKNDEAI